MSNRNLKAFVRYDGSGRIVPGSLILQAEAPKVGNWKQIDAYECCNPTTTTIAPAPSCYVGVEKFDIYNGGYFIQVNPDGVSALILDVAKLPGLPPLTGYSWDQAAIAAAANTSGGYTDWRVPTAAEWQIIGDSMWDGVLPLEDWSIYWSADAFDSTTGIAFVQGDGTAVGPQYTDYNTTANYPKSEVNIFVICVRTDYCLG